MARNAACPECKSGKEKEVINGGMVQTFHWEGNYVVYEETTYEKNLDHSTFYCDNSDCTNYDREI